MDQPFQLTVLSSIIKRDSCLEIVLTHNLRCISVLGLCGTRDTLLVNSALTYVSRQSKLSHDELDQLQKDTHFDKKELQQWYKGDPPPRPLPVISTNEILVPQAS